MNLIFESSRRMRNSCYNYTRNYATTYFNIYSCYFYWARFVIFYYFSFKFQECKFIDWLYQELEFLLCELSWKIGYMKAQRVCVSFRVWYYILKRTSYIIIELIVNWSFFFFFRKLFVFRL